MTVPKFVHCDQHGRPHALEEDGTCWCGCIKDYPDFGRNATVLGAATLEEAAKECETKGLWLYDPNNYKV